ncbi:nectin-2 precursor [Xenopus tropicalis]|uniref:MGC69188 protein n=1 Tax=Xenopus tropicalis TaxID=8364 RepID=Q6GL25_XENTR|eukprot:NP_001004860.1 nectin-2 precursor [Xenopus tropicalis]
MYRLCSVLLLLCPVLQAQEINVNEKVTGTLGQQITLPCTFNNNGVDMQVTQIMWMKDSTNLATYSPQFGIHVQNKNDFNLTASPSSATLLIKLLRASDEGNYICEVTTFPGGNRRGITYLSVKAEPRNSAEALPVIAGDIEVPVAKCASANGRPPSQITWRSTLPGNFDTTMNNNTDGTYTVVSNYKLVPTWTADKQEVICIISYDSKESVIPITLSIQYSPIVTIEGYDNNWYLKRLGASLTCNAHGNPQPTVYTWKTADGSPLPNTVKAKDNVLYVDEVDERVNTTIVCEVTNALGSRASQQEVLVRERALENQTNNAGAIAGGVIGGVLVLLLLAAVIFILIRRGGVHKKERGSYNPKPRIFGSGKPSQEFTYQDDSEMGKPLKASGPLRDSGLSPSLAEEEEDESEERMKYNVLEDDDEEEKFNEVGPMLQLRPHHDPYLDDDMESQTDGSIISRTAVYV